MIPLKLPITAAACLFTAIASSFAASNAPDLEKLLTQEELAQLPRSPDGEKAYSGDLILYPNKVDPFGAAGGRLWTRGEFVFQFTDQTATQQQAFRDACAAWTIGTALRCLERVNQSNYVRVLTHNGEGCGGIADASCSAIGMRGGVQDIEIANGHWTSPSVLQHEIGHALGLIHEQARPDRDNYVIIHYGNIRPHAGHNFDVHDQATILSEYDYNSIMHYSNCSFTTKFPCNSNDKSTESNWTISPAPCALVRVGGSQITALDLDGIRRAYGGPIAALYGDQRVASCGTHQYSKSQVEMVCGSACAAAAPVQWSRLFQEYDWGCGFMPRLDGPNFCSGRKQEFRAQWWDKDDFHSKCWGGTLTERWTECGCTSQSLTAMCTNYQGPIDLSKLASLINSEDQNLKQTGLLIQRLINYADEGYFSSALIDRMPEVVMAAYVRADPLATAAFYCHVRVEMTIQRILNSEYEMSVSRFERLARDYNII